MKRFISVLISLAIVFAVFPYALAEEFDVKNFEPFELTVSRAVINGTNLRLVVKNVVIQDTALTSDDLSNLQIKGIIKNETEESIEIYEVISSAEVRDNDTVLVIPLPEGYDNGADYTYDLKLYPAATVNDFKPFTLNITALGRGTAGEGGKSRVRMVAPAEQFPFDATVENILAGCIISGTMTRTDETDYPQSVVFTDVPVEISTLRTDGKINVELKVTDEINVTNIQCDTNGYKQYTIELTIFPAEEAPQIPSPSPSPGELSIPDNETTFFVKPDDFAIDKGTWTINNDGVMEGLHDKNITSETASAIINVSEDGTYYIWVLAYDNAESYQGERTFKVRINEETLANTLGNHGSTGYKWQLAGTYELKKGECVVKAVDISNYYARMKGIMFTTSSDFEGVNPELLNEAFEKYGAEIVECVQIDIEPAKGDKVIYNIKNRTDENVTGGRLYAAVYDENGTLVEVNIVDDISINEKEQTGRQTIEFSGRGEWKTGKLMLLDENIKPLAKAGEFVFTQTDLANPDEGSDDDYGTAKDMMLDYVNEKEFHERSGVSNVLTKLEKGQDITIGYVGTSITHGNTWRPATTKWFKEKYPSSNIEEVSIAASGTNSNLGACLVKPMLLEPHHPDIVFVEYVMDGGKGEWMEGIVRQIWQFDPTIDIYMVHPVHTTNYNVYEKGEVNALTAEYERVAEHYNIPSVNLNYQIFDLYNQGKLTLKASAPETGKILFSKDGIHPTADGGYIYAGAIARSVLKMSENRPEEAVSHDVPAEPLYTNNWSDATSTTDLSMAKLEGSWIDCTVDNNSSGYGTNFEYKGGYLDLIKYMFPTMKATKTPGSSITIKFIGTTVGLFEVGGQYSGRYSIKIDDKEPYTFDSINRYCTKLRHQYFFIPEQQYGEHTVKITLLDEVPDIKQELKDANPKDDVYNRLESYIGHILVRGEVVDITGN